MRAENRISYVNVQQRIGKAGRLTKTGQEKTRLLVPMPGVGDPAATHLMV